MFGENTVPHMLSGKAIASMFRGHTLTELAIYALIISELFEVLLKIRKVEENEPGSLSGRSNLNETLATSFSGNDIKFSILTIQEDTSASTVSTRKSDKTRDRYMRHCWR